ncbi:hypothetical protein N0V90_003569 [Kalmusia sp. IMI 367209]|nr:hypothetical protein N0V90_003569 [Kalmusia sp. IMI 367209]
MAPLPAPQPFSKSTPRSPTIVPLSARNMPPPEPSLTNVATQLEAASAQLRQIGQNTQQDKKVQQALLAMNARINGLAKEVIDTRNNLNARMTRLEALEWNRRARQMNLERRQGEKRLVKLGHHLTNKPIPAFPSNVDEFDKLSGMN